MVRLAAESRILLSFFLTESRETIIGELETLAVAMAVLLWGDRLFSSQLVVYIDNEGAKFSLIRGYSASKAISAICALTATALDKHVILPWYSRVPSVSNLADFPSRDEPHQLLPKKSQSPKADVLRVFQECLNFLKRFG